MAYFSQVVWRIALPSPRPCCLCGNTTLLTGLWGTGGQQRDMAGHSKWSNIKHIKALKDGQKQKMTSKCSHMIKLAVKEGGSPDPKLNSKLGKVIEFARSQNIPMTTVNNAIKQSQKTQDNTKSVLLEYRAPGGILLLAEVLTDNLIRTKASIQTVIKKSNVREAKGVGSAHHVFDEKGVLAASTGEEGGLESALEAAIEVGAEEVVEEGDSFMFTCSPDDLVSVQRGLEGLGYSIAHSSIEFLPKAAVSVQEEEAHRLGVIMEKLEELDEVMKVHINL